MIWKRNILRAVLGSWVLALVVSVAPVYSAGSGGEQTDPEPNDGGGFCIDCHEHQD